MSLFAPIRGLCPRPEAAAAIAELPYDVMSRDEAIAMAAGRPHSFLHVSRPDIDLPDGAADDGPQSISTDDFTVDLAAHRVSRGDQVVRLTPTEWSLLELLVRHAGKLVPGRQLLTEVWGPVYEHETHYLRVYLAQLRRKLEPDPAHPRYLITEPGVGYRFEP